MEFFEAWCKLSEIILDYGKFDISYNDNNEAFEKEEQ